MKKIQFLAIFAIWAFTHVSLSACTAREKAESVKQGTQKVVCDDWLRPDSLASVNLGNRLTDVLINANKVRAYSLVPKEKVTADDVEIDSHFVRDSLLAILTKEQAASLKYSLISHGVNYHRDTTFVIRSPYCPVIEFEFVRKKEVAHVFVSLSDFRWGILYDGKVQFKYNYGNGTFVHRFCDYFLAMKKQKK